MTSLTATVDAHVPRVRVTASIDGTLMCGTYRAASALHAAQIVEALRDCDNWHTNAVDHEGVCTLRVTASRGRLRILLRPAHTPALASTHVEAQLALCKHEIADCRKEIATLAAAVLRLKRRT